MHWSGVNIYLFVVMSLLPPLIAAARKSQVGFVGSFVMSAWAVAWLNYSDAATPPIALLLLSFVVAFRSPRGDAPRWAPWMLFGLVCLASAGGVARVGWWFYSQNWGPPKIFNDAMAGTATLDQEMANILKALNARFPQGTNEAEVRSELSRQGFEENPGQPRYLCRLANSPSTMHSFTWCPPGTRGMVYAWSGFVCSGHIVVHWSVDQDGQVVGLDADRQLSCL